MAPTPGIPKTFLQRAPIPREEPLHVTLPHTDPPASKAQPGVTVSGPGWKLSVPMVALTSIITAFGVRMLPTPSAQDNKQDAIAVQIQMAELRAERAREDTRREFASLHDEVSKMRTEQSVMGQEVAALRSRLRDVEVRPNAQTVK